MAVRAVLTMSVPPERSAEFEREWTRVADWVRIQPGCLRQTLASAPGGYVITSDWTDPATFGRFERGSRQDAQTEGLRRLRTSVRMEVLTVVAHLESP